MFFLSSTLKLEWRWVEKDMPGIKILILQSPLRIEQVEGTQGFLPQPGKALERPSSTRLEARFPYHGSGSPFLSSTHRYEVDDIDEEGKE